MAFDGTEGKSITLQEGSTLTSNYRNANPNATLGHYIGKDIINTILGQSGCVGIRVYYGLDSSGEKQLVFVGVDANGNDMVTGTIADRTVGCPQSCSTGNALNS